MSKQVEQAHESLPRLIPFREVNHLCGLSRSAVWRLEREGKFPPRRLVTESKVGWILSEVLSWIAERTPVGVDAMPTHNLPHKEGDDLKSGSKTLSRSWIDRDD